MLCCMIETSSGIMLGVATGVFSVPFVSRYLEFRKLPRLEIGGVEIHWRDG